MKRIILAAVVIAVTTIGANAQFRSINPEVGLNFAHVAGKDTKSMTGIKAGASATIDLGSKGFYIEPGLFYTQKGTKVKSGNVIASKANFNYLELPVNIGYRYDMGRSGSVFAFAGPYAAMALSGHITDYTGPVGTDGNLKPGDNFLRMDYGANFGLGYVSPWGVYIRGQYSMGIGGSPHASTGGANRVLSVSLGYTINLK